MNEETKLLIEEYAKNPVNNFKMTNFTIKQHEGNFICGDDITVYLIIEENNVKGYSFDGNCPTITTAAASFLSDLIIGEDIQNILKRNYTTLIEKGFEVSPRRKRAAVIAIMASQNAIYKYLGENKRVEFDDLIDD